MITTTSLTHPATLTAVGRAMRQAVSLPGCPVQPCNAQGVPWLGVVYISSPGLAWPLLGRSSGFFFYDPRNAAADITPLVLQVLRSSV